MQQNQHNLAAFITVISMQWCVAYAFKSGDKDIDCSRRSSSLSLK